MLTRKVNLDTDTIICSDFSGIQFERLSGGQKKNGTANTMLGQISGPALVGPAASMTALIPFYYRCRKINTDLF